jgi:DNA-binding response OmpR family regulator
MPGETVLVIDDSPTILKVVQLVLTKAGFHVRTAGDGEQGIDLAREKRPDLILLDFVMPKMNGYQVCRALGDEEGLRDVPIVLMSAKGDQVGERFVKVMGIVDYITKPFSPDAITAVVSHTIGKYKKAAPEPVVPPPVVSLSASGAHPVVADAAAPGGEARRRALEEMRATLAQAVVGRQGGNGELEEVARRAAAALDDSLLERVLEGVRATCPELLVDPDASLLGELRVVPLAEVLQLLQLQAQSGVLTITRPGGRVGVYFRGGRVELATSNGVSEEFLIGRFVLEQNLMSKQDLDLLLKSRNETGGRLLGAQLIKLGHLSESDLKQVMGRQTSELVYEVLRWNFGRGHPHGRLPPRRRMAPDRARDRRLRYRVFAQRGRGGADRPRPPHAGGAGGARACQRQEQCQGDHPLLADGVLRRHQDALPPALHQAPAPARDAGGGVGARGGEVAKILIAEDSATSVELLRRALSPLGHEILVATDGEDAEKQIAAERPDLLILDIILPKRNGFQLCRWIRANPDVKAVPIILVTSMDRESDRYWGLKQGADEYLIKPVDPALLCAKVRAYIP